MRWPNVANLLLKEPAFSFLAYPKKVYVIFPCLKVRQLMYVQNLQGRQ